MCSIAVVFSEAAHVMPADLRYFCLKAEHFHSAFMQSLHLYRWTTSVATRVMCVHKSGTTKQSKHVCLLDGGLWQFFFAVRLNMW